MGKFIGVLVAWCERVCILRFLVACLGLVGFLMFGSLSGGGSVVVAFLFRRLYECEHLLRGREDVVDVGGGWVIDDGKVNREVVGVWWSVVVKEIRCWRECVVRFPL